MADDRTPPDETRFSRRRGLWLFLAAGAGVLLLFLGSTGLRIVSAAGESPTHKADAIVVFGAAEYAGRPSPVFRARLDHGFE